MCKRYTRDSFYCKKKVRICLKYFGEVKQKVVHGWQHTVIRHSSDFMTLVTEPPAAPEGEPEKSWSTHTCCCAVSQTCRSSTLPPVCELVFWMFTLLSPMMTVHLGKVSVVCCEELLLFSCTTAGLFSQNSCLEAASGRQNNVCINTKPKKS